MAHLSDPLPHLEWMGVQRFVSGNNASARDFFARARELVLRRQPEQGSLKLREGASDGGVKNGHKFGRADHGKARQAVSTDDLSTPGNFPNVPTKTPAEGAWRDTDITTGEFHPDAMRLDRCAAVSICRQGPEAF